ncbi:2-oxo-4-hydroxy-4-carboxy-5-ureidoimidazoline decarboxylase [uncultured Jatrophihabitans sp.]|uniref:2-oxo-4-hydroxy-4-carboxy-5-ureidoimidazoline decarboxylase n=1 Tax=uncultured Jatrophihabitans sp. TaxID=1610747 RepID=UPI0035CA7654
MSEALINVVAFDAVSTPAAVELLRPVCASTQWLQALADGRPYGKFGAVVERSDAVLADVPWTGVEEAMTAHPRIGERAAGADRESSWSRQEQSSASAATVDDSTALHEGNVAYEQHFGHVFLVCATGRTPRQILDALNERLDNDVDTERQVVRRELAAIVRLRLAKVLT